IQRKWQLNLISFFLSSISAGRKSRHFASRWKRGGALTHHRRKRAPSVSFFFKFLFHFLSTLHRQVLKLCSQLETVLSCCQAKRDKLRETKELEQKWLEEKTQVLKAAKNHVEQLQKEKEDISVHSMLQDIKEKIQKMKAYQETLMECLGDILEKHVPLPQMEAGPSRRKKSADSQISQELVSLSEILEVLMNKALQSPHDPYVIVDETFWPPYVEMLLRYGMAVRHQENSFKIRLGAFF
uniref:Centromere protein K n=1 Tax=Oryzias latipes TaxID=8090 RepID=A0A3B3HHQ2_ORYLA